MNSADRQQPTGAITFATSCLGDAIYYGSRSLIIAGTVFVGAVLFLLLVFRFVDPPASSVMLQHWLSGQRVQQTWVSLDRISPNLQRAVVASEDAKFCKHFGLDLGELAFVIRQAKKRIVGCARRKHHHNAGLTQPFPVARQIVTSEGDGNRHRSNDGIRLAKVENS